MPAMGFFDKLKSGLKKTKESFLGTVDTILAGFEIGRASCRERV